MTAFVPTPELDKQKQVIDSGRAGTVQGFIDWLVENHYVIQRRCPKGQHGGTFCHACDGTGLLGPVHDFEQLMADHFGIHRDKIENERRALLAWIQRDD